jgi:hypothetical protein
MSNLHAGEGGFWKDPTGKSAKPDGKSTFMGVIGKRLAELRALYRREELREKSVPCNSVRQGVPCHSVQPKGWNAPWLLLERLPINRIYFISNWNMSQFFYFNWF